MDFTNNLKNTSCCPTQVLNINDPITDFSNITVYNSSNEKLCNECLEYSYSLDGITWSCWLKYNDAANILFEQETDYFIRIKISDSIGKVLIDNTEINNYSTSLFQCFDFTQLSKITSNIYNPYNNMDSAMSLYQSLSDMVSNIVGIPIYYIKLSPNQNSKDITFKEYTLMDVESIKQIKLIVKDGQMPSSKPEFSDFGFDFSTDWETEISKTVFSSAFGIHAKPMEGDLIYIPMMKRMWMVNNSYDEKNEGLMWQSTVFKVLLIKYEDKGSVDLGDAQSFVDSIVQTKYDDLFGTDENKMSGTDTVSSPSSAALPIYPVFESDAVRKYVKHSNGLTDINAKLINFQTYTNNILISNYAYDWTQLFDESYIIYQTQFCGTDATISFIINPSNNYCKGSLLKIANVDINIDMTPTSVYIKVNDFISLRLENNKTYFIYIRWSKNMGIIDMSSVEYKYPENMPVYAVQPFNWYFDFNKTNTNASKYDIELNQNTKGDVILYSFDGKITNIKVYDKYIDNVSELLQMYPTNQHLIINDTARKFVDLPGLPLR